MLSERDIEKLVSHVKLKFGFDFGQYAMSSFSRRLMRIMEMDELNSVNELILKLKEKGYYDIFLNEVTVNVTDMFRDPEVWIDLRKQIIKKLARKDQFDIWHMACSTGEEVYSMCIALHEAGVLDKARIVASDINMDVIRQAQEGKYWYRRLPNYERNYKKFNPDGDFSQYYERKGDYVYFNRDLIKNVKFKYFNLVDDTNFSKYNLMLCRNVLIYFNDELKKKIIKMIYESLVPKGYFIIGAQESILWDQGEDWFMSVNNRSRFWKKLKEHNPEEELVSKKIKSDEL